MDPSTTRPWIAAVLIVGAFYLLSGLVFGELAGRATDRPMVVAWRLAAWGTSGIAFGAHIVYEVFRLRHTRGITALHTTYAVVLGCFGLAAAALARALATGTGSPRLLAIALVAWPVLAGLPAFLVSLGTAAVLTRVQRYL
jgi:hypothetical protein